VKEGTLPKLQGADDDDITLGRIQHQRLVLRQGFPGNLIPAEVE
jgi:hypothetical protein